MLFSARPAGDAAILPRIVAIGDIDEDEIAFAEAAVGEIASEALALPPALDPLERRLLLTRLITQWAQSPELHGASGAPLIAQTPAAACALADDLARLIDDMNTRGVSWDRLDDLVPETFDEYWQLTLRFLQIARQIWPAILKDHNRIESDRAARRADQGGSAAPCTQNRRAGHRCRLDRLDSIDGGTHRHHRAAAAWRRGAARTRH